MNMSQSLTRHLKSSREKLILSLSSELRVLLLTITKFFLSSLDEDGKKNPPISSLQTQNATKTE